MSTAYPTATVYFSNRYFTNNLTSVSVDPSFQSVMTFKLAIYFLSSIQHNIPLRDLEDGA